MYFDFRTFFRTIYFSFFKWKELPAPFNARRVLFLIAFFIIYPLVQLFNGICLLLDNIFFPQWRKIKLKEPVFIVGNPRSGTTFIHRMMARDEDRFFCFRTWELIFPAIIQKKTLSLIGRIDRSIGSIFGKLIQRIESRLFRDFTKMHRLGLFAPEEDDKLTIHIFSSLDLLWLFPFQELTYHFSRFDELVEPKDRKRIMTFYKNCVKRQAYFKGNKGHFLSKNPVCPPKIKSLYEYFPGCKFIYPVRNPLEVVPSMINMAHEMWRSIINMDAGYPLQDNVYDTLKYYYTYPLRQFSQASQDSYVIVKYDDLVRRPSKIVQDIYRKFGFEMSPAFQEILNEQEAKAKDYKSKHVYSLDQFHISREQILSDLSDVFREFNFDTGGKTGSLDERINGDTKEELKE